MAEFYFLRPFWLLLTIPTLLLWWQFIRQQDLLSQWGKDIDPHLLQHLLVGKEQQSWFRPIHLFLVTLLLASLAMAGPSYKKEPSPFLDDEAGLMILLKVSKTMEATDVQPSRLTRAKQKISDLMDLRQGSATGLIVYSGSSHLVMPLTRDDRIINTMLTDLEPQLMPLDGDNLAGAVDLAEQILEKTGHPASLLVVADTVSPSQLSKLQTKERQLPIQFLSMLPPTTAIDSGLKSTADSLKASVIPLSIDPSDVEKISRSAERKFSSVTLSDQGERAHDSGYILLPFIALCTLLWFRKGWVLQ
ncbi:MAG: VWA domain-containing protein [Thermodesulfobacteriota bacterium]